MKQAKQESERWFKQAEHFLEAAEKNLNKLFFYSDACFFAEQAAQAVLKAYLFFKGERFVFLHSVRELALACAKYDKDFKKAAEEGRILDHYYIPTRYPDALAPPAVPFESYTKKQALEAVALSKRITGLVKKKIFS